MKDMIKRLLSGNEKNRQQKIYIWNSAAGLMNAGKNVVLSMLVTRVCGMESAGILSLAIAVSNLMMTVGKYGIRNFQVTDTENKYSFSDYFSSRLITVLVMGIMSIAYVMINACLYHYSFAKSWIIIGICAIFCIECAEDVFAGDFQKKGRLDIGSRIFVYRWFIMLAVWGIILLVTKSLAYSVTAALGICIPVTYFFVKSSYAEEYYGFKIQKKVINILKVCAPICISNFMIYYVANASKYSIDKYLGEELQAVYGFLSMTVFAIGLLSSFIYQPVLTQTAADWENQRWELFAGKIMKQLIIILGISLFAILAAHFWGTPILSLLYNTDLNIYHDMLIWLLIGSSAFAIEGYLSVILTVMRKQNWLMGIYALITIGVFFLSDTIVQRWELWGATILYVVPMFMLTIFFGILIVIFLFRAKFPGTVKDC